VTACVADSSLAAARPRLVASLPCSGPAAALQRPAALGVLAIALVLAPVVAAPDSLAWFGPVLVAKLVVAHAVREEPYRPMR